MNKTMKLFSMAALVLMGAVMIGCSSDDDDRQPENKGKKVTLTTTIGFDGDETRALTSDGVKTFAVDETMAIVYKNTSGTTVKAVSAALTAGDIQSGNKTATFTFELTDPDRTKNVTYIYPAAMANSDGTINYDALNSQNGSLSTISSTLDLATYTGAWSAGALPAGTLSNQLAICAFTIKDVDGSENLTSSIKSMTVSDGTNSYTVTPSSLSTIYVAIRPTTSATISYTATDDDSNKYWKIVEGKTYIAGKIFQLGLRMLPNPIIWDSSNVNDLHVWGNPYSWEDSYTKDYITLRGNADNVDANWDNYGYGYGINFNMKASGGYTFKAPTGKKFTKIEMTVYGYDGWYTAAYNNKLGSGWPSGEDAANNIYSTNKVTWTGDATSTVDLLTDAGLVSFGGSTVSSIAFTLE